MEQQVPDPVVVTYMDEQAVEIINNLLVMIVLVYRKWNEHLDETQKELLEDYPTWIRPALEYLEGEDEITLANSEWIKMMKEV